MLKKGKVGKVALHKPVSISRPDKDALISACRASFAEKKGVKAKIVASEGGALTPGARGTYDRIIPRLSSTYAQSRMAATGKASFSAPRKD